MITVEPLLEIDLTETSSQPSLARRLTIAKLKPVPPFSSDQFLNQRRLDDVIARAEFQTGDFVGFGGFRREHYNRCIFRQRFAPKAAAKFRTETVLFFTFHFSVLTSQFSLSFLHRVESKFLNFRIRRLFLSNFELLSQ